MGYAVLRKQTILRSWAKSWPLRTEIFSGGFVQGIYRRNSLGGFVKFAPSVRLWEITDGWTDFHKIWHWVALTTFADRCRFGKNSATTNRHSNTKIYKENLLQANSSPLIGRYVCRGTTDNAARSAVFGPEIQNIPSTSSNYAAIFAMSPHRIVLGLNYCRLAVLHCYDVGGHDMVSKTRQSTYNLTVRRFRAAIVGVEKQ